MFRTCRCSRRSTGILFLKTIFGFRIIYIFVNYSNESKSFKPLN